MRSSKKTTGGDCYQAAANYVVDHGFYGRNKGLVLVHGIVTGQGVIAGLLYGHAWVEDGETVIDVSNGRDIRMPKAVYYALGHCKPKKFYTPQEAAEKMVNTGHYGPWDYQPPR